MKNLSRPVRRGLILVLIVVISAIINSSFQDEAIVEVQIKEILGTDDIPNYYSDNLQLREFNDKGELLSLLKTNRLSHYKEQQKAYLELPQLIVYGPKGNIWNVTSQKGEIEDVSRSLKLSENVLIIVTSMDNQHRATIKTSELNYDAITQFLWTDKIISANSIEGKFSSLGLKMDLNTELMLLNSKVKIHYDM